VFTARYELIPYVKQTLFVFKGLACTATVGKVIFHNNKLNATVIIQINV